MSRVPASLRIEIHHDFAVLERRLEDLLRALKREHGPLAPAAVVVPTARLRAHLQETLAERCGTLCEVRFFHHDSLAAEAAADAAADGPGAAALRPIGDAAREAIAAEAAARVGGAMARWLAAVPTGAGAVLSTLDDLREAGIDAAAARRVAGLDDETRALLEVYSRYTQAFDRLRAAGFADRAGRIAAVLPHLPRFASRFQLIVHYGAYELVGMNLDLMRAAQASGVPTVYLAPGHPTAPAFAYARSFWKESFGIDPLVIDREGPSEEGRAGGDDRRPMAASLPLLYDEERTGAGGAEAEFFHAQGSGGELREAALLALRDHATAKTSARRIAVLARGLEPYGDRLADRARAHTLPFTTSASSPAASGGAARAALLLLRAVVLDFPAAPLLQLVRSGRLVAPRGTDPATAVDSWERLLRHYGLFGGRDLLSRTLPGWVEESPPPAARRPVPGSEEEPRRRRALLADAVHLSRLVTALERESADLLAARDGAAFAAAARSLFARRLAPFSSALGNDAGVSVVAEALADLEAMHAAGVRLETPAAALTAIERGLAGARSPLIAVGPDGEPRDRDEGGVRVLDVMQARGLSFDTVLLLGMNAGRFPRPVRPDPFLGDDDRRRLRTALGRPVPIKEDSRLEEHLLLALALGAARRRIVVGWQRADDEGRALSPSLALREIARVTLGTPDLETIVTTARSAGGDPLRGESGNRNEALLPRGEALVAAAIGAGSPRELAARLDAIEPLLPGGMLLPVKAGLEFLAAIEAPEDRGFDALVGSAATVAVDAAPDPARRRFSPSRLELLGSCPQQYFFRRLLHLEEWDDERAPYSLDPREIGVAVHEALATIYTRAAAAPPTGPDAIATLVDAAWQEAAARIAARLDPFYPGLWEQFGGAWRDAIVRFVKSDLPALLATGDPFECETWFETMLQLPGRDEPLVLGGRFDRLRTSRGRVIVSDYKTGGDLAQIVRPSEWLKGRRLQMPLYALLARTGARPEAGAPGGTGDRPGATAPSGIGAEVLVEVLGVGPRYERSPAGARADLDNAKLLQVSEGFFETLGVLVRLTDLGLYPLNESSEHCERCAFRRACRRGHGATLERLARRPELRDYRGLRRKSTRAPLLAATAEPGPGADE